jgi:hypothetical protein
MKTTIGSLILGLGLVFILGCTKYPPASDRLLEDLAVITQYDTKVDFNNYHTFSIAEDIVKVTDIDTTHLTSQEALAVLDQITKNMEARGFMKIMPPEKADLAINVIYYENTYVYTYYYNWWGYYPSWYYYYPYYPVYYSSYTAGMATIEMIDLKVIDNDNEKLEMRWNAYIRGLLTGSRTNADITHSVDQAFIQTPQIQTTAN